MKKTKAIHRVYLIHAVSALCFGAGIYLLFRKNTHLNRWFGINGPLSDLPCRKLVNLLRYYLADAAWGYALTFSLASVTRLSLAVIGTVAWGMLWEILQQLKVVTGTFDLLDILAYLLSAAVAAAIIYFIPKETST